MALAIEALSWMDLKRINGRLALQLTADQLGIQDEYIMRQAFRLIMETTRKRNSIDYLIALAMKQAEFEDLSLGVQSFLRIYTFEVKYGERAFREIVEIADLAREILGSRKLVLTEEALDLIPHLEIYFEDLPENEAIALQSFHPIWFVRYCKELFGRKEALRFLKAPEPPTYIRINSLKGSDEEILERLSADGVEFAEVGLKNAYKIVDQTRPLNFLESFRDGLFAVQDKASVLAGLVASPESGITVLDVCAAPGGKTGHLSQLMENQGRIYSMDFSQRRLDVWKGEMERLGVENAVPILGDARKLKEFPNTKAELVLLDPPCSGTGTFGHIPSGKWRLNRRSIDRMASIQRRILENCAMHLREGGNLIYCTCSVTLEENEKVMEAFLREHSEFRMVEKEPRIGLPGLKGQIEAQRLYPHTHMCNGFYIATLFKK